MVSFLDVLQEQRRLNPEKYLEGTNKFQFLDLSASAGISEEDMKSFLQGKGILEGKENVYLNAAATYHISEVYLVAHSALETGNGTSPLAMGYSINGTTVYNMYGINAKDGIALESYVAWNTSVCYRYWVGRKANIQYC